MFGNASRWALILAVFLAPLPADAFGPQAHHLAAAEAGRAVLWAPDERLPCPSPADLASFLEYVRAALAEAALPPERAELDRLWPPAVDPAFALKGLMDLTRDPRHAVEGIDRVTCEGPATAVDILAAAAVLPDDDGRNQDRTAFAPDGRPLAGTTGPFPEDPMVLRMGGMTGLSSQAHAHYALARDYLTGSPIALLRDPAHFAVGSPQTFAPDQARVHLLLAQLAWNRGGPGSQRLALMFLGAALHYVQDASDPLHTVQVGAPCVILPALGRYVARVFATGGGLLGTLPSPVSVGTDPVSNLHLWTEALWDRAAGSMAADAAHAARVARDGGRPSIGIEALWAVADPARQRGPGLYRDACNATAADLRRPGVRLEEAGLDPAAHQADPDAAGRVLLVGRESVSLATAASTDVLRAWRVEVDGTPRGTIGGLRAARAFLDERLPAVRDRQARQEEFRASHPEGVLPAGGTRVWWVLPVELGVLGLIAWLVVRRRRKARGKG